MIVAYFGADRSLLPDDNGLTIHRRNMAVLYTISQLDNVETVINCIRTTRRKSIKESYRNQKGNYLEFYFAPIFPERGILKKFTRSINLRLLRLLYPNIFRRINESKVVNWCYWPKGFNDWKFLRFKGKLVFDTDHNIIENPNVPIEMRGKKEKEFITIGKRVDLIISSSRTMLDWFESRGCKNTSLMLNGVFRERINLEASETNNEEYTVTYCGTLSKWIKVDWLLELIKTYPNWYFNIIGADYKTTISKEFQCFRNVRLHGFLNPDNVDRILKKSNVAIGLYNEDPALDVNSMKLYDYLAQNVPVVINNYHPYLIEDFKGTIALANTLEEFILLIKKPIKISNRELKRFLIQSQWKNRVKTVFESYLADIK